MNPNDTWVIVYNGTYYPIINVKTVSAVTGHDQILDRFMRFDARPAYYSSREEAWVSVYEYRYVIERKYQLTINFNFSDKGYDLYRDRIRKAQ